jgi:MFS family permease
MHREQQQHRNGGGSLRHRSSFELIANDSPDNAIEDNTNSNNDSDEAIDRPLLWNYQRDENSSDDDNDNDDDAENDDEVLSPVAISQQHYASTAAICLCTFTHSWLLVSVFPYAGFMVIDLVPGTNEETVGTKAGLLSAAFMIGRALTSYAWGKLADTYGRRVVLFTSLLLSVIFSLLFGVSTSFWMAFFWRFLLGASNGVAGIAKAIVSETARGDDVLETRGMSLSIGMWAWGFLLSPGISGFLSDPIRQYSQLDSWLSHDGFLYRSLKRFPFILPNLISVVLCFIDIVAVEMWVPETLPKEHLRSPSLIMKDCAHWLKRLASGRPRNRVSAQRDDSVVLVPSSNEHPETNSHLSQHNSDVKQARMTHTESVSLLSTSYPHLHPGSETPPADSQETIPDNETHEKATLAFLWSKHDTRNHLLLYWIFSFVAIAIDEAFPLFCISKTGGLGISARAIGKLLSATGLIFAITQYHVYAWIVDKYGLSRSIQIGAFLSAPIVVFVPLSLILNTTNGSSSSSPGSTNTLTWSAFLFLAMLLGVCRIFGLVFFSSITIATNRTVIPCHRGTMNGLSMLGGSVAKGLGPIVAGSLTAFGISSGTLSPHAGAVFVFLVIGVSALLTACMTLCMLHPKSEREEFPSTESGPQNGGASNATA